MKNIETILDECIDQLRAGSRMDEVLKKHPEAEDELRSLLGVSQGLQALPDPTPSVEGLMRAMSQQITRPARVQERRQAKIPFFSRPALLRFAAGFTVFFFLGWSTVAASSDAVPGNFMYPVKRFAEKMHLIFSVNDKDEAELRITFSERRLAEALKTYQQGGGIDDGLLRQMLEESKQALNQALALSPEERSYLLSRVGYLTAHQNNVLETVKRTAGPEDQADLEPISELCGRRMHWMEEMFAKENMMSPSCPDCRGPSTETRRNDVEKDKERPQTMESWMNDCPM